MRHSRLLVIGAGGHAKVVGDCAVASGAWSECLFFDDRWPGVKSCGPWLVAGGYDDLFSQAGRNDEIFVAIGNNTLRLEWLTRLNNLDIEPPRIVHPAAWVSPHADLGPGTLVVAGAVVNAEARLGLGCIANTGCSIDHDCCLGDAVHVSPGARLAGGVEVGSLSWLGIGCAVIQRRKIGSRVTVGAGSVVIDDIPDGVTVVGAPAKPI